MSKEQEVQEKYYALQLGVAQLEELNRQSALLQNKIAELMILESALLDLQKTKSKTKIFSALGSGIYVAAEILNTDSVLINVGANVFVKKPIEEAIFLIKDQRSQTESLFVELEKTAQNLQQQILKLQKDLQNVQIS